VPVVGVDRGRVVLLASCASLPIPDETTAAWL